MYCIKKTNVTKLKSELKKSISDAKLGPANDNVEEGAFLNISRLSFYQCISSYETSSKGWENSSVGA